MQLKELYQFGKDSLHRNSIESPGLEAYLLLSEAEVISSRAEVYTNPEKDIDKDMADKFHELINRRLKREPIAYIAEEKEFYSRLFRVSPGVLIPRPETELLVEETLGIAELCATSPLILEIGTGSGCIAVTLAHENENALIVASDISMEALLIAEANSNIHKQSDRISLIRADLLSSFQNSEFDIVVSNPPYISAGEFEELESDVKDFEPSSALVAGEDGLCFIREIISGGRQVLKDGGWCLLEIGKGQRQSVAQLFEEFGFTEISSTRDLNGVERVIKAKWKK